MAAERMRRVDEAIRQVLADALAGELADPRVGFVTVTDVKTSPDLRTARVFVSVLGDDDARARPLAGAAQRARRAAARGSPAQLHLQAHADARVRLRLDDRPRAARRDAAAGASDERGGIGGARHARAGAARDPHAASASPSSRHEHLDGDALGSLVAMQARAARARQGLGDRDRARGVPAAAGVPLLRARRAAAPRRPQDLDERTAIFLDCGNLDRNPLAALRDAEPLAEHRPPPRQHALRHRQPRRRGGLLHRRDRLGPDARARRRADAARSPRRSTSGWSPTPAASPTRTRRRARTAWPPS